MSSCIPIFYACDDSFVKYTIVSIQSMIANSSAQEHYHIYILNTNICPAMRQRVLELKNANFDIEFVDVSGYLHDIRDKLPLRDYYSLTTYFRLFIAEMFPQYDKAIYIDSDTVVLDDIAKLYHHELGDNYVGAAVDQVMVQMDVFGRYVEQVVGIDRNRFFNAGLLLLNCRQFRENHLLERFADLLRVYNFVVTQDEDYLNVLCQGKVLWLDPRWNTLVIGEIPFTDYKILHYNMVSKPWHYPDCRLKEYFWQYAEQTAVYDEICATLNAYTDEQRCKDALSGERLKQTAQREIDREDNYYKLLTAGKLKSPDRLRVLEKIARLEQAGCFDQDVEEDPPTRELKPEDIDYLRTKLSSKLKTRCSFAIARVYLNKMLRSRQIILKEIKGLEHYQNLRSGAIITCNHFNANDSFAMQMVYEASGQKSRKFYRVIREGNYTNFPGFYGILMRNCNTLPLSSNAKTMQKFTRAVDKALQDGHFVLFYPEQSMWWNYRKPKPLKKGAYTFAVRDRVPVLPCFITMQDSDVLDENGFYVQEYTVHISAPIYPDPTLSRSENVQLLQQKNADAWKEIYEQTYHEPLTYANKKDALA